jgi:DNA-binding response OmpR family regulator
VSLILVIEDDPLVARLLLHVLTRAGHSVTHAESGPAALERLAAQAPDLIVLDVRLPGLDGFGVLERVRSRGPLPPVIMLTAERGTRDRALAAGADEHMHKPFDMGELTACVRRLTQRR